MANQRVTVFGGSGFLGRHIVQRLLNDNYQVVVASRRPRVELFRRHASASTAVTADIRDPQSVRAAIQGAGAVINAVGLYVESRGARFADVHVTGARHVASEAARVGARLVHISGIGVSERSKSAYVRARAGGEQQVVRHAQPDCAILRPSVLFGPNDTLLQTLEGISRLPLVPLFGRGGMRLQPVFVDDVAEAVARVLKIPAPQAAIFELGGPEALSYRDLMQRVCDHLGRRRALVPVPLAAWDTLAAVLSLMPNPALTRDQVILMSDDNVVAEDAYTFRQLGIVPRSLGDELPRCLPGR